MKHGKTDFFGGWGELLPAAVALMLFASAAHGTDYYLKSGAVDWSQASSYCTDASRTIDAAALPGPDDSVHVLAETFVFDCSTETGRASLAAVSNVYEVVPSVGSVLEFNIPSGEAAVGCRMRIDQTSASRNKATLVKKGAGILSLLATEPDGYLYAVTVDIRAGGLKVAQGTILNQNMGNLLLASGATIWNPCSPDHASQVYFTLIKAEEGSLITNATTRLQLTGDPHVMGVTGDYNEESYIKGVVGRGVRIWSSGSIRLEGTENTMAHQVTPEGNGGRFHSLKPGECRGVISVKRFGMINGGPSSLGTGSGAYLGMGSGGGLRYIGEGNETTDKTFNFSAYTNPSFIDAGPAGGLTFTGQFAPGKNSSSSPYGVLSLYFTGSNATESVVAGIMSRLIDENDVLYPVFISKSGTGTWRFTDSWNRYHVGGMAVLDGTLKFDSIDEKGFWCSLGNASRLTKDERFAVANNEFVDYAFTLGGGDGDPVLEYSGNLDAVCTTRPIALAGRGGHLRASNGRLKFGGAYARDTNSVPVLVLDGAGTNELSNVSDGADGASVSIVKDGTGTWTLAGEQMFSGGITVSNGTLAVRAPVKAEYADYKWFRLSIAQIGTNKTSILKLRQICLFDKDGVRQNEGLTLAREPTATNTVGTVVATEIAPGQVYYDKLAADLKFKVLEDAGDLNQAFDGVYSGAVSLGGRFHITWLSKTASNLSPDPANRSTWIPITMHLPDSANPITHFDVQGYAKSVQNLPTRILMEASTDGLTWHEVWSNLHDGDEALAAHTTGYNQWISDGVEAKESSPSSLVRTLGEEGMTLSSSGGGVPAYFSWFRFSIARTGNSLNALSFRQIGLYDEFGNRLNAGLTLAEPTNAVGVVRTIQGTVPAAGQVGYDVSAAGMCIKRKNDDGGEFEACFVDKYNGTPGRCIVEWYMGDGTTALNPAIDARRTWIPLVMHLASPVQVHHFDVQAYGQGDLGGVPVQILLEGSTDGRNWFTMYDNVTQGEAFSNTSPKYNRWLSDGVEASDSNHARPAGKGFNVLTSCIPDEPDATQFPNGMRVQVLSGGMFVASTNLAVSTLVVDANNAGTIKDVTFAATGTLDVQNLGDGLVLPGVYDGCTGMDNIANWTLLFDGQRKSGRRAVVSNGQITIIPKGISISFR